MSGTNAHAILEEAPPAPVPEASESASQMPVVPFMISAKSAQALAAQAERLRLHLMVRTEIELLDVAATLALHRAHLPVRVAILAANREELLVGLHAVARGQAGGALRVAARRDARCRSHRGRL